jgi:hypothetical protein
MCRWPIFGSSYFLWTEGLCVSTGRYEVGAVEMRFREVGAVQMRSREVGPFQMRFREEGPFQMRFP